MNNVNFRFVRFFSPKNYQNTPKTRVISYEKGSLTDILKKTKMGIPAEKKEGFIELYTALQRSKRESKNTHR